MKTLGSTYYIFPLMFTYKGWRVTVYKVRHLGIKRLKMKVVFELSAESMAADYAIGRGAPETYLSSYRHCLELAESFMQGRKQRIEKNFLVSSGASERFDNEECNIFHQNLNDIYFRYPGRPSFVASEGRRKASAFIDSCLKDVQSQWFRFLEEHTTWEQ